MYCERCMRITEDECCPVCGGKRMRTPEPTDPCFLTEQDFVSTGILEDILQQNGIPFLKKNVMGAGMAIKVGPMLERTRFYVPFDRLGEAETLAEELFAVTEDTGETVTE